MKHIVKGSEPAQLRQWINGQPVENGRRINCSYRDMPGTVKAVVKQRLILEQGGLCCYTGISVTETQSHIEHFLPQTLCTDTDYKDVEYTNLLAAYPGEDRPTCPFGARARGSWYDPVLLVSPLRGDCERRFVFRLNGRIEAANSGDDGAVQTIKKLHLDHESLAELRKQQIDAVLFPASRQLSNNQLKRIAEVYCQKDRQQRYRPFCFVVQQAANELLRKAERERIRRTAIHQQEHIS